MSKNKPGQFRVTIDGYGTAEVVARTAGSAVCRARRAIQKRFNTRLGGIVVLGKQVKTVAAREVGWWKNVHCEFLKQA